MNNDDRTTIKMVHFIRGQLRRLAHQRSQDIQQQTTSVATTLEQIQTNRRKLTVAMQRGYDGAASRLRQRIGHVLGDLKYQVDAATRATAQNPSPIPTMRDLMRELDQLREEFGSWRHEPHDQSISVLTDSIVLDGVYFGPFEVRLQLAYLSECAHRSVYYTIAQDPQPAAGNDAVTHPHVSDDRMCPGEAHTAIVAALETGRFCDFFMLVRSVLNTYNPESPYVRIEEWDGEPCSDCGYRIFEDSRYFCESCERDYCDECISGCRLCDLTMCLSCLKNCSFCDESVCKECLSACTACGERCCRDCLADDLCPTCTESKESQHDDESQEDQGTNTQATGQESYQAA